MRLKILKNSIVSADEITFVNNNNAGEGEEEEGSGEDGTGGGYSETGISVLRLVDDL